MSTKRLYKGGLKFATLLLILSLTLPLALGSMASPTLAASDEPPFTGEPTTALQIELATAISKRHAAGLPIPEVTFISQAAGIQSFNTQSPLLMQAEASETTTSATTIVYYDGPKQAGYDEWPALEISGSLAGDDAYSFNTGDLTEVYRDGIETQMPGFWEQVEFGQEARKYSIEETLEFSPAVDESRLFTSLLGSPEVTTSEYVLMGFTVTGPKIDHTIKYTASACLPDWLGGDCVDLLELKAGFQLDWAFGLRLPASATFSGPDQVELGSEAYFQTSLAPQDWEESQYTAYGVAPENGNEFVFRYNFWAGVKIAVLGSDICFIPIGGVKYPCYKEFETNGSQSFPTPFGKGTSFPIKELEIELYKFGVEDVLTFAAYLTIKPTLTSTEIKADWQGSGDCSGTGTVIYTEPDTPVSFGPVPFCNLDNDPETNEAQVVLENFRYYFNEFKILFGGKVTVNVFGVYEGSKDEPFYTLDLSKIFEALDLHVGDHIQCTQENITSPYVCERAGLPNELILTITTKDETPPVTTIQLSGTAGTNDWYVSDVQVTLTGADVPAGCGSGVKETKYSLDGTNWNVYTAPFTISSEGTTTVSYYSVDAEDNVETTKTQTIQIDKTPPTITGAPTQAANSYGWYRTDVLVHFVAADTVSGIDSVTPDQLLSSEGANQSVTGTAVDMAGWTSSFTVTGINIDKTNPTISIISPEAKVYENTETFNIIWSASDSLSGLASESGNLDGNVVTNGQLVELLLYSPGPHTTVAEAFDKADNYASASVLFNVSVDSEGLLAALWYMCDLGWINKHGICNSLEAKLDAAIKSIEKGNLNAAENQLNAFISELEAQNGKSITPAAFDVLKADALFVIEHLSK